MKAAYINEPGPPENIIVGDLPTPEPTGSEVLVKIAAAAINPIDTYLRSGAIAMDLPCPYVTGSDLAGVVEAVGPAASRFQVGNRVWGSNQGFFGRQGTCSEYAAVDECWLYPTPVDVTDEVAAAGALVGITAHLGLFHNANLQAGETLFVNGGTGGIGSTVLQIAKAVGARVITTGSSAEKLKACKAMGADLAINYRTEEVAKQVLEFAPEGVNVYWDVTRNPDFDLAVNCLSERGRMVVMAGRESRPEFPLGPFYVKELRLSGFVMFKAKAAEQRTYAEDINRWLAEGKYKPRIDRVVPLEASAAAHRAQQESTVDNTCALAGKIVVRP
jgi:NADPH2:quinone reductase